MNIALIDFEASCLPSYGQSFPIEVALAKPDGTSRNWLIKPSPEWEHWSWSSEAEALHGISREMLERDGLPPARVLAELIVAAQGCQVYSDAEVDVYWLDVLAQAERARVPFPVLFLGQLFSEWGCTREQVVRALDEAKRQLPRKHRARDDASRLALVARLLHEAVGID